MKSLAHKKDNYIKRLGELEDRLDIPHFLIWLRRTRSLSQSDLSRLTGLSVNQISQLEKARSVFPYKSLRKLHNEVLTPSEKVYFLECLKGHVQTLLESPDDETFREIVKTTKV